MPSYVERLDALQERINQHHESEDPEDEAYIDLLKGVIAVVHDAEADSAPHLPEITNQAGDILDSAINWAYGDGDFDFLKLYAESSERPLVEDPFGFLQGLGNGAAQSLLKLVEKWMTRGEGAPGSREEMRAKLLPSSWTQSHRPHPKSTRLSRFRDNISISATDTTPLAQSILQARCEIESDTFPCPVGAKLSSDSSAYVVIAQGGWKHRDPVLGIHLIEEGSDSHIPADDEDESTYQHRHYRSMVLEPGFAEVAYQLAIDSQHKLAVAADSERVKTFYYGRAGEVAFGDWQPARGKNVHTLDSHRYDGPIAVLPGDRIARAGKGDIAIWNLQDLRTHKNGKRVGKGKLHIGNSMRDNESDEIERSSGSAPSTTIRFGQGQEYFTPVVWELHEPTGRMLAGESGRKTAGHYGCFALDLENGAKKVARYLGHGGHIEGFSISSEDANVFATGCGDGYARLYDVRHPLPVITLDAGRSSEFVSSLNLVHPDGLPVLFTGGDRSQSIMAWDIRARALVYELGTGNNAVRALSWDAKRNALYAATECDYMDRNGYTHDYRSARIPRWARLDPNDHSDFPMSEGMEVDEDEEEEYDSLEDDNDDCAWPNMAHHSETHFGYAYDAGEHVLLRYGFKEDPDLKELPEYGQATVESDNYW